MPTWFPIQFDRPGWLLLLLLVIPIIWMARGGFGGISRGQSRVATTLRVLVIALLAISLARPAMVKRGEGLTLMMVVDVSRSIPVPLKAKSERFLKDVAEGKREPSDRVGVITVAKDPAIAALPNEYSGVSTSVQGASLDSTNLASAVRTALALLPQDTANRLLLVSDGNETEENVLAAVEVARANGIPVDVLPVEYEYPSEVTFEGMRVPTRARIGQFDEVRMFLRSQQEVPGTLFLWQNDEPIDLDPESPGPGLKMTLSPGPNIHSQPIEFTTGGTRQFRAVFQPDDDAQDVITENNESVGVTFVSGEGSVLIVAESDTEALPLVNVLLGSDIRADIVAPDALIGGLSFLNGYDSVVLMNVPKWALPLDVDGALHAYVHDLGGGLIMTGGPESFGAGGWIDSEVAKALPVKLDPPQTRQMPRGALALIMHSCEMPQGNYWGQQVAIAAIEALSSLDYVGIVTFNWGAVGPNINGASWAFPMQLAGDKTAAIAAAKGMVVGDMPDFQGSMQVALQGLQGINAGQRHVIIISDGDPQSPPQSLLDKFIAAKITITTVMVAGHGTLSHQAAMKYVASQTGGTFYSVNNPKELPKIFVKEAQMVARSLIVEGLNIQPTVVPLPGPVASFPVVPQVEGYVLTANREGLSQVPIFNRTPEADDPIYANWNYGLGKAVAFTSDATGRWGRPWVAWGDFRSFWEQSIRWTMRPPTPANLALNTRQEGDTAVVELEAIDEGSGFLNFLRTEARVLAPDNTVRPLALQQIGPGRYRAEFPIEEEGAYLVNVAYTSADGESRGTIQGAVTVPYAREFRTVRDNLALLRAVADRTGGRVLTMDDPTLVDFFERDGLELPLSPKRIWDLLTILAASLFVLDVASRRIAVDRDVVGGLGRKLFRPTEEKGEETVAAWKRARQQAASRRPESEPTDRAVAARKFEAEEGAGADFDVAAEARGESTERSTPDAPPPAAATGEQGPAQDDGLSATERLLRAKRRVQHDDESDGDDGGGRG